MLLTRSWYSLHTNGNMAPDSMPSNKSCDVQPIRIGLDHQHVHRVARTYLLVFYQPLCGLKRIYGPPIGRREPLR